MSKKMWRATAGVCVAVLSMWAFAANESAAKAPKVVSKEGPAETEIRKAVEQVVTTPGAVESVRKAGYGNFYEVVLSNSDMLYVDPTGSFLISGTLIDIKAKKNVTAARVTEMQRIDFSDLPLGDAIKHVRGNGKRVLVTFEDPNCGYCKKLAKDILNLKDTTVYTFMIPILTPDSAEKSKSIWCSSDRVKAWNDWMVDNKAPAAPVTCENPIAKNGELARKLRVSGTPTMFLTDGNRLGGYVALAELDKAINEAASNATKK